MLKRQKYFIFKKINTSFTRFYILLLALLFLNACNYFKKKENYNKNIAKSSILLLQKKPIPDSSTTGSQPQFEVIFSKVEQAMISNGCVDINIIDSSIVVDLKYSTTDNFLGFDIYGDLNTCYLQTDVAEKLSHAQQILKSKFPFYNLIVYDGARPRMVQYKMWDSIAVPYNQRSLYLSNPSEGSLHNFGAAVDLSIIDKNGCVLDMGTPYDYFGELAYPREEKRMIFEGKLSYKQLLNRELLRSTMEIAGFTGITSEWWHFNSCSRREAFLKYLIIN